jgi:hypothetical protein
MNVEMAESPYSSPPFSFSGETMSDEAPKAPPIQLQLDEVTAQGIYANLVMINHSENEFVLDFAYLQPTSPAAKVRARIISSPRHTKRLLLALQKNVARYEERFGVIELSSEEPILH